MVIFHPEVKAYFEFFSQMSESCQSVILLNPMSLILGHWVEEGGRVDQIEEWEEYEVNTKSHDFHKFPLISTTNVVVRLSLGFDFDCQWIIWISVVSYQEWISLWKDTSSYKDEYRK